METSGAAAPVLTNALPKYLISDDLKDGNGNATSAFKTNGNGEKESENALIQAKQSTDVASKDTIVIVHPDPATSGAASIQAADKSALHETSMDDEIPVISELRAVRRENTEPAHDGGSIPMASPDPSPRR